MPEDYLIVKCAGCGAKNRVDINRRDRRPVCGKCRRVLDLASMNAGVVKVTDADFDSSVLSFAGPVIVDCWAPWCGPCRMIGPVMEELARDYAGRVRIAKLNVDENPSVAARYAIRSIPTILFVDSGKVVDTLTGAVPRSAIEEKIRTAFPRV